jgi:hypothetical protein
MNNKRNQGIQSLEKIKLFMNYSLEKTLSENILEQEHIKTKSDLMYQDWEKEEKDSENAKKEKEENDWKLGCKYPDKALLPPKNEAGVEGKDALIDGFCFYPSPGKNGISGIYIPKDSKIDWWTVDLISFAVDQHLEKYPDEDRKLLIQNFSDIFPLGTVFNFYVGENRYTTRISLNSTTGLWEFKYFYRIGDNKIYEPPIWVDNRTSYQKFVDEYGFAVQMTAALATAIAGALTGGAAWVLYAEIALEGGLGLAVGLRDMEKGENVSAALSFITGILPMLKLSKVFTGIPEKEFIELSKELKNAGLTATSDVSKYVEFYNGLTPNKQKIMSKLLKQDDYFKSQLLKSLDDELPKIVNKGLEKMVKENPKLLQSIPFFERLWVRELGSNSIFITILTLINVVYGDVLNDKDVERLKGVYSVVPESLKKEMAFNLLANGDKIKEIINSESFKSIEKIANTKKVGANWAKWYNTKLKDSITQAGGTYIELSDDTSKAVQNIDKGRKDEKIFRKQGWVPMSELKDGQEMYDFQIINSVDWVKVIPN